MRSCVRTLHLHRHRLRSGRSSIPRRQRWNRKLAAYWILRLRGSMTAVGGASLSTAMTVLEQLIPINPSTVVPAKAGTHSPWHWLFEKGIRRFALTRGHGVWIPAFAGTTVGGRIGSTFCNSCCAWPRVGKPELLCHNEMQQHVACAGSAWNRRVRPKKSRRISCLMFACSPAVSNSPKGRW